ncbi:MAG: hypothetical protein PHI12_07530 [Dehalococcoidales bacterium]|nr:hypothetical protein [Dehalococcoidales bacterium]
MDYVVLRETRGLASDLPFSAFYVKDDGELEARIGKDILEGDIVISISKASKQKVVPRKPLTLDVTEI